MAVKFPEFEYSTKVILKVVFVVLALVFVWVVRDIILIVLLSLILASAMDPMVDYLNQNQRIPRAVSVLTVYLVVFGLGALALAFLLPPVLEQFKILVNNFPEYAGNLQEHLDNPIFSGVNISEIVSSLVHGSGNGGGVVSTTYNVFSGALSFITVLVISFYLVAEEKGMKNFVATLMPVRHQELTLQLLEKIQRKMGLWVLGQFILSCFIFAFTFIGLSILGVKYALFLALLAGALEIVPYIGPFVSAVPAVIFAFSQSSALGLAVAILYLLIQKTEGYVLVPKIMQKTVGTSPLVVLLSLLIGFKVAGVIGLLVSVPLVSAAIVVLEEFYGEKPSPVNL